MPWVIFFFFPRCFPKSWRQVSFFSRPATNRCKINMLSREHVTHLQHRSQRHSECGWGKPTPPPLQPIKQIFHSKKCHFVSSTCQETKGTGDPTGTGDRAGVAALGMLSCCPQTTAARSEEPERRKPSAPYTSRRGDRVCVLRAWIKAKFSKLF